MEMGNHAIPSENETRRQVALEKFGYQQAGASTSDEELQREWALLLQDFPVEARQGGELADLAPDVRDLAAEHVRQRRETDRLFLECERAHLRIAAEGARPDLVEAYAVVRDGFEQAVEDFSAHRELLTKALSGPTPNSGPALPA